MPIPIPPDTQKQFPALIELIVGSQSMDDEERGYWVSVLPGMTPAQRDQLQGILEREKTQLQSIEGGALRAPSVVGAQRKTKRDKLQSVEEEAQQQDAAAAEQLLQ